MLPLCLELNFKNGIFLGRIFWSFLEMSHVKQDHQWAVGSGLSGASLGNGVGEGEIGWEKEQKQRRVKAGCDKGAKIPVLETGPGLRIYSNGSGIMVGRREGRVPCQQGCGNAPSRYPPPKPVGTLLTVSIHQRNGPIPEPATSLPCCLAGKGMEGGGPELPQALTRAEARYPLSGLIFFWKRGTPGSVHSSGSVFPCLGRSNKVPAREGF